MCLVSLEAARFIRNYIMLEGKFPRVARSNYRLIALDWLLINELRSASEGKLTRVIT